MIDITNLNFQYKNLDGGTVDDVNLHINKGEIVLICGRSGCGKTTITRFLNGLVPHYYEGNIGGTILVDGINVRKTELKYISRKVGSVFQNPRSQFFCVDTSGEIVFGCENEGLDSDETKKRYINTVRGFHIEDLMGRSIFELSGGEKQKIACASACATSPDLIVLDEPTSNLDVDAINELAKIVKAWKKQGKTVVIAEHRLYWLKDLCDRVIYMDEGQIQFDITMERFCEFPIDKLQKLGLRTMDINTLHLENNQIMKGNRIQTPTSVPSPNIVFQNFKYKYKKQKEYAINIEKLSIPQNEVIAIIGHNGAGKSTFSQCLCGLNRHFKGKIQVGNHAKTIKSGDGYMVMQDVNHQLFCDTVMSDVTLNVNNEKRERANEILKQLDLFTLKNRHPMSLSGGQKQRVAVAGAVLSDKNFLIFDEPTSGLDYDHMQKTAELLRSFVGIKTVLVVTHDLELIMKACGYVIHIDEGKLIESYKLDENGVNKLKDFFKF